MNIQKLEIVSALLRTGCPYVLLDSRADTVTVPAALRAPDLVLRLGFRGEMAMPDLQLDGGGFSCTIARQGVHDIVLVPWTAVRQAWLRPDEADYATMVVSWAPSHEPVEAPKPDESKVSKAPRGLRLVK